MKSGVARVLGPYQNGTKWRVIIKEGGTRKSVVYATKEEAEQVMGQLRDTLKTRSGKNLGEAVEEYLVHKRKRGCNERTVRTVHDRLVRFLPIDADLNSIRPPDAEKMYAAEAERFAAATHHKSLRETKAFFTYCVKQGFIEQNPFADVHSIGKANAGKQQLRTDEARKLSELLLSEAEKGDIRALALMVQVLLGLRSGEVLKLRKRDLDCGGRVLVIEGTKSKNARRTLELNAPSVRELLLRRCERLQAADLIFARDGATTPMAVSMLWKGLHMYCRRAEVPVVCPHSLRGLHSSLAVKAGATSTYVAEALGHGSDAVTRRHYIAPAALDSARAARVAGALLGETDLDGLIGTLRNLSGEELSKICAALGLRR